MIIKKNVKLVLYRPYGDNTGPLGRINVAAISISADFRIVYNYLHFAKCVGALLRVPHTYTIYRSKTDYTVPWRA